MPTQPTFTCATCDYVIAHHPVFHLGLAFCCAGCAADGPCMCSYDAVAQPGLEARARVGAPAPAVARVPRTLAAAVTAGVAQVSPAPRGEARRRLDGRRRTEEPTLVDVGG